MPPMQMTAKPPNTTTSVKCGNPATAQALPLIITMMASKTNSIFEAVLNKMPISGCSSDSNRNWDTPKSTWDTRGQIRLDVLKNKIGTLRYPCYQPRRTHGDSILHGQEHPLLCMPELRRGG